MPDAPIHTIDYSSSVAIRVRYLGPTDTLGARFHVWRSDCAFRQDPDRISVPFDHGLAHYQRAEEAVRQYLARKLGTASTWAGRWIVAGASDTEYIAVRVPR